MTTGEWEEYMGKGYVTDEKGIEMQVFMSQKGASGGYKVYVGEGFIHVLLISY